MNKTILSKDLLVADVLDRWPETVTVFLKQRMGCVGCSMAPFETLSEAAKIYDLCCTHFLNDLQASINTQVMA
jgi:hybrid cluster-associated redox disulfide protein